MPPIHGALPQASNFEGKKYLKKIKPESSTEASSLTSNSREAAPNNNMRYHTHHH